MGVSGLEDEGEGHTEGDQADSSSEQGIDSVFDEINERFGTKGIVHGKTLRRGKKNL